MSRQNDRNNGGGFHNRGYRPLNSGYGVDRKGYVSNTETTGLPKPPQGGTGQSPAPQGSATGSVAQSTGAGTSTAKHGH